MRCRFLFAAFTATPLSDAFWRSAPLYFAALRYIIGSHTRELYDTISRRHLFCVFSRPERFIRMPCAPFSVSSPPFFELELDFLRHAEAVRHLLLSCCAAISFDAAFLEISLLYLRFYISVVCGVISLITFVYALYAAAPEDAPGAACFAEAIFLFSYLCQS